MGVLALAIVAAPGGAMGDELLGDPGGARSWLGRFGILLQLFYHQNLSGKPEGGGADPEGVFGHSGSYDFFARIDLDELSGWRGADLLLHLKGQYDRNVNEEVGALSDPIDDADFDDPLYLDELWLEQSVLADRLRLRLGFLEQQTLFDRNAYANSEDRQFLATALDNNPILPLPNGLGAFARIAVTPGLDLALGVADAENEPGQAGFDTAFDGVDSLTGYLELKLHSPWERRGLPGSARLGFVFDGRALLDFRTGRRERGHPGAYLSLDQLAYRERPASAQGLGVFARGGWMEPNVNQVAWFWSLGLRYQGSLPGRDGDVVAAAVHQSIGSGVYRDEVDSSFGRETGIEVYYRIAALSWLAVTPDFQYIIDPGATGEADDAIVATLRLRVSF